MRRFYFITFLFFTSILLGQKKTLNDKSIDSILIIVDTISSPANQIKELILNTNKLRYSNKTLTLLNKALSISDKEKLKNQYSSIYYSLGNYYYYNSKLDSASNYLEKAKTFSNFDTNPFINVSILTTQSGIQKRNGNVSLSITSLLEAKEILDKIDTTNLSTQEIYKFKGKNLVINNSLANLYNNTEDYQTALLYYDKAFNSALSLISKTAKANAGSILSNKGDLLIKMNRNEEALEILLKSKELKLEGSASPVVVAGSEINIGIAQTHLKKYPEALSNFDKALATYLEVNHQSGIAYVFAYRGSLFNKIKDYNKAVIDCEKAKTLSEKQHNLELKLEACKCLTDAYRELGSFEKAFENQELYLIAKDSFISEKNIKQLTQLQMQYDFDKQQEHQKIEADKKEQQRKLFLYLAIAALIIIVLLGFFFIKNRKKNFQISEALQEKEILLKEIHHRVKNNLQVVSSLLSLQQRQTKDTNAQQALQEGRNRVKAMALIHQNLYQDNNLVGVDLEQYITKLVSNLVNTYKTDTKSIQINTNIDKLKLDVDTIIPLGLIINELISNSLKYAFIKKDSGEISVDLKIVNNFLKLVVSDNGVGLPDDFSIENTTSLGYKLIRSFSQKLDADFNIKSTTKGTLITLIIKKYKAE